MLKERLEKLAEEQNQLIKKLVPSQYYKCHFFNSRYTNESTCYAKDLNDEIQRLAIKDGYNLVKFENGHYGYVAYYNGHENGFEFIPCSEKEWEEN